jgi:hypothetical protein
MVDGAIMITFFEHGRAEIIAFDLTETEVTLSDCLFLLMKGFLVCFQSMPLSAGDAHPMRRRLLSVTIHSTQASLTNKWVQLSKVFSKPLICLFNSNDDGLMLTAVSHQVLNNHSDLHKHLVQFAKKWSN